MKKSGEQKDRLMILVTSTIDFATYYFNFCNEMNSSILNKKQRKVWLTILTTTIDFAGYIIAISSMK